MFQFLFNLYVRLHGLRPIDSPVGEYVTDDGQKIIWYQRKHWFAYGSDHGTNAMEARGFRRIKDAARYANYAQPEQFKSFPHWVRH